MKVTEKFKQHHKKGGIVTNNMSENGEESVSSENMRFGLSSPENGIFSKSTTSNSTGGTSTSTKSNGNGKKKSKKSTEEPNKANKKEQEQVLFIKILIIQETPVQIPLDLN